MKILVENPMTSSFQFLIAQEGGEVLGFVHYSVKRPKKKNEQGPGQGIIPFLAYPRGQRQVGQALIEAAEADFRARAVHRVVAFPFSDSYPFYHLDQASLSDRLDHVQALLTFNGYARKDGEVFMDWMDFQPAVPLLLDSYGDIVLTWMEGKGPLPNLQVEAVQDKKSLGLCECLSFRHFGNLTLERDWLFVKGLNVAKGMQGQKLGLYLLQRALEEMRQAHYRHAAISASHDNPRAFLFYTNHGFRAFDTTYEFVRELT